MVFVNFANESKQDIPYLSESDLSDNDRKELEKVLSHQEASVIIKTHLTKQKNKKLNKTRYLVSEDAYVKIVSDLNQRLVSNLLTQLVNKGLVDTAFDSEANDFIFWAKDDVKNQEKPETD
jgi:hypothetical protein